MKTKKQIKQEIQNAIMQRACDAMYEIDFEHMTFDEGCEYQNHLKKQINRMEALFGYEINSWSIA